jgi:thiosulfate reductase cytochrome b subunit
LRLDFHHGEGKYNFLQKLAYGLVLIVLLPLMLLTGLAISPGTDAALPWLVDVFGGRQSARSIHFIVAWCVFGFFVIHVVLVLLSGPIGQLRDMITGGRIDETP